LVSNRIDRPGEGENAVAEALERAAATFTTMAIQHKQKDDALSYAHAKNEYLIADIQERDKLQDDQDFATHSERYNEAMKGHYERLFPTVRSERDRGLFDADARLMNARGTVAVGDNARVKEIDWNVAELARHGEALQGVIMAASDAQTAQDGMFAYLDHANSLLTKGFLDEITHQVATQSFVTATARKRLIAMDPKLREVLLERSITLAKTQGEPITREQILAGLGSDSIADFLPLDERVTMLEVTSKGNEHDEHMRQAWEIRDEVIARGLPASKVGPAMNAAAKDADWEVRQAVAGLALELRRDHAANKALKQNEILIAASANMDRNMNPEDMNGDDWGLLTEDMKENLKADWASRRDRDGFGNVDTAYTPVKPDAEKHMVGPDGEILLGEGTPDPSYAYWMSIPRDERVGVPLQTSPWRMAFTKLGHKQLVDEQDKIRDEQASGKPFTRTPGPTPMQRVEGALIGNETIKPKFADRTADHHKAYWATVMNYHRALAAEEERLEHRLSTEEEERVLSLLLEDKAFTDSYWTGRYWPGGPETSEAEKKFIGSASPEVLNKMREPLSPDQTLTSGGQTYTHRKHLVTMGFNAEPPINDPSEYNLERAHFAMVHLLDTSGERHGLDATKSQLQDVDREILRRLRGD
jgi:hypothetical protein